MSERQKIIWNGEESPRKMEADTAIWDGSLENCKFRFFCYKCNMEVIMEDARNYENDEGILRTKCKCPLCHKWTWLPN